MLASQILRRYLRDLRYEHIADLSSDLEEKPSQSSDSPASDFERE